jgi:hypothetical protein
MNYLRNYVSGHFKTKIRIPDIILLLEGLMAMCLYPTDVSLQKSDQILNKFLAKHVIFVKMI